MADIERRDRILALAKAKRLRQVDLVAASGMEGAAGQVSMSRWSRGKEHLSEEKLAAIESYLAECPTRDEVAGVLPAAEQLELERADCEELAGDVDEGTRDEDQLAKLAKRHRRAAVGGILKIALTSKSDATRLRAWEALLERTDGKPIQATVDKTIRAPIEDEDLLQKIHAIVATTEPTSSSG
jgi:transcriptional regulator with XRE-family HTH domain